MISITLLGHNFNEDLEELVRLFVPKDFDENSIELILKSEVIIKNGKEIAYSIVLENNQKVAESTLEISKRALFHKDKALKWEIRRSFYTVLAKYFNRSLTWGILTGIRPSKIVQDMFAENLDEKEIINVLRDFYFISEPKIALLLHVAKEETKILTASKPNSIALYIGIPFCASRCLYCSFTSNSIKKYEKKVPFYLNALKKEIQAVSQMIKSKNYEIESIYIGGGTPTALSTESLQEVLDCITQNFKLSDTKEYTVEAGRPDTITTSKLQAIKNAGATRISINPQTMNDEILTLIGRNHNSKQVLTTFQMARELGFSNINMDIIAGLPGDNIESFRNTLDKVLELKPENLTVHTFSLKRASVFNQKKDDYLLPEDVSQMVDTAYSYAIREGFHPYYMYRQRNILGNLENVGYCQKGFESVYNIQIMEERQTIIAMGAGAISKVYYKDENRLERIFNDKSVEGYIERIDEMIERKRSIEW